MEKKIFWEEFKKKQSSTLEKLLKKASCTACGKSYQFSQIKSPEALHSKVPLGDYASHLAWLVCSRNGHLPEALELDKKVMEQNETYDVLRKQEEGLLPAKLIQLEASIFEDFLKQGTGFHSQRKIPLCLPRNQEYFIEIVKKYL